AWATNATPATVPKSSSSKFRPFHISPVKQATDIPDNKTEARNAVHHSCEVWAVSGLVPVRLSIGVRNQNRDSAAIVNASSGQSRGADATADATPVNSGTSSNPQAPCSRGTIRAHRRARQAARTASLVSVVTVSSFGLRLVV